MSFDGGNIFLTIAFCLLK